MISKKGLLAIIGILATLMVLSLGSLAWRYMIAEPEGVVGAKEQIESSNNRIQQYEMFYALCANVQTLKRTLATQQTLLGQIESETGTERTLTNIGALHAQISRVVNEYNTRSQMKTREKFKSANLPYRLFVDGETSCGN